MKRKVTEAAGATPAPGSTCGAIADEHGLYPCVLPDGHKGSHRRAGAAPEGAAPREHLRPGPLATLDGPGPELPPTAGATVARDSDSSSHQHADDSAALSGSVVSQEQERSE